MFRIVAVIVLASSSLAGASERVVWQIGEPDRNYQEFAIAGDHESYRDHFPGPRPVFTVGTSDPARHWPFIHPGPADSWAGSRVHPLAIRFSLPEEPQGVFTLRIQLCDAHGRQPPTYAITIGERTGRFRLKPGGGDDSLTDPTAGKPQKIELALPADLFRKGDNQIVLACQEGSWVQYDALALLNDPAGKMPLPEVHTLTVTPTILFVREDDQLRRVVEVGVTLTAPAADVTLRVEAGGEKSEMSVDELDGFVSLSREVGLPDSAEPLDVKVTATVDGRSKSTTVTVPPQRKWKIFVAASAHTDIGYTHLQPECAERNSQNIDTAIELIKQYPDFKWNCEVAWQVENFLATRDENQIARFLELARQRKIGVQALYVNILTGLCSHEEFCRQTYLAHRLHREHGVPYSCAMINDVPTCVGATPMMLAGAGIRYFSNGINNTRGYTFTEMYDKSPCWWEGPDGSRVLMVFIKSIAYAWRFGLHDDLETARKRTTAIIREYEEREHYPYDAIFGNGAVSDNRLVDPRLPVVAKEWNDRYAFPEMILCDNAEFFEYIEENYGDQLPVVRGSGGTYWEDGAGSSARETALCRNAHESLDSAERLLSLASRLDSRQQYPRQTVDEAWRNAMLYDEHTWGSSYSVREPDHEQAIGQWKIKSQFAVDADQQSRQLLEQGANALASLVNIEDRSLVVLNTASWPRTDLLEVSLPEGTSVVDPSSACCRVGETTLAIVRDVPSCGYRALRLGPKADVPTAQPLEGTRIESRFYSLQFDPTTGAITSLMDEELDRELVDGKASYQLNQYLYVSGGDDSRIVRDQSPDAELVIHSPEKATLRAVSLGELGQRMIIESSAEMTPAITTEVTVWNDLKRVDISNRLTKTRTHDKEAVYFAYPFAADKPTFRYEAPLVIQRPDEHMLPGACLDWFTVQHFVQVESSDAAITWSTPDAPLVCFQDINRGKWQTELPITNGHLYAYVMNNYWFTNYQPGQGGELTFRFSITSDAKADTVESARFGWAASNPLIAVKTDAQLDRPLPSGASSLVEIDQPNVLVIGMKQPEAGEGLLLRLWEIAGKPTTAQVRLPGVSFKRATACSLVEEPQEPLGIRNGTVSVPILASGVATVLLE